MRNLCEPELVKYRDHEADKIFGTKDDERARGGAFLIQRQSAGYGLARVTFLRVIASSGDGWDHVSISLSDRCPTWDEMEFVKRLFFRPDETAMQLHVPPSQHINNHPYTLHLWRPQNAEIPRPPGDLVGLAGVTPEQMPLIAAQAGFKP